MPSDLAVEQQGRSAIVHLRGDLIVPTVGPLYAGLRSVAGRRDVDSVVLDFSDVGRIDSSGSAVLALIERQLARGGKHLELEQLGDQHRAALALAAPAESDAEAAADQTKPRASGTPRSTTAVQPPLSAPVQMIERLGEQVSEAGSGVAALGRLIGQTLAQLGRVLVRRAQLPAGELSHQVELMGVNAVAIVALLSFLIGMTMAFQGAVELQRFGAGVFVADMIGVLTVRELAPLMTAIIITGRTGAAIAAELGTMQVGSELDALSAMGISPIRFLVVPRMIAISLIGPALTLISIAVGIIGGVVVASLVVGMPGVAFWTRLVERLNLGDFGYGLGKSLVFAWVIGLAGSHLGISAGRDAGSVGAATTRTVVVSVFLIVVVDALFATIDTLGGG